MAKTLSQTYRETIAPALCKTLGVKNVHALPRVKAIKINVGIGSYVVAGKDPEDIVKNVIAISGQKPVVTHARQAISNFKLK